MAKCRVALLSPEASSLAAAGQGLVQQFADLNIFRVLLHRPRTAKALGDLLLSLLFGGELDHRLRELLIMRIGWSTGSNYEWTQHWTIAQQRFACSEADLLAVREGARSAHFGEEERLLLTAVDELLADGTLGEPRVAECVEHFGRDATIELVTAVGCWQMVSKLARSLDVPLEEGVASWPPDGEVPAAARD